MARPRSIMPVALCLCAATVVATPVHAAPRAVIPQADLFAPAEVVSLPAPGSTPPADAHELGRHASRASAPAATPGLPFAPTGWRWMQPRIRVPAAPLLPDAIERDTRPTPPFLVVRTTSGRPLVLAVTPPGDPPPPPRPRRRWHAAPFALGLATFALSYLAAWAAATDFREECEGGNQLACRREVFMYIPVAGPLLADRSPRPGFAALTAFQAAGLVAAVVGAVAFLVDRHRREVLAARGIRLAKHTAIRLDGGPYGGQIALHQRF